VIKNLENEEAKARYWAVKINENGCNAKKTNLDSETLNAAQ